MKFTNTTFQIELLLLVITCSLFSQIARAEQPNFDRGGVSVDFLKADKNRLLKVNETTKVLFRENADSIDTKTGLPPGWGRGFNLFSTLSQEKPLKKLIAPLAVQKVTEEDDNRYLTLQTDIKAQTMRATHSKSSSKVKPDFCGSISHWVALPAPYKTRKLRIRFRYRGVVPEGLKGVNHLLVQCFSTDRTDSPWRGKRIDYKQGWLTRFNNQWQDGELDILCTNEAKSIAIYLKNYGCSKIDIDDIVFEEVQREDAGLSVFLTPQYFTDNVYCLTPEEPAFLKLTLLNESGFETNNPVTVLELPEGVKVIDARAPLKLIKTLSVERDGKKFVQYHYAIQYLKRHIWREKINHYNCCYFMLGNSLKVSEARYPAHYWVQDGSYSSKPKHFELKVIEPVQSRRPKQYRSGAVVNRIFDVQSENNMQTLVDFYADKGLNSIHIGGAPSKLLKLLTDKNITRYTQPTAWLANGYRIGTGKKPDEVRFQFQDGSNHPGGICPVAVYQPGEYYRNHVEAPLRKVLVKDRSADHIMSNWEPYMFKYKGCFCQRCKAEFARYAKLSPEQINKDWPDRILVKHRKTWVKFRSWQHGMLMKQLEKTVVKVGKEAGIESHFMPEISVRSLDEEGLAAHFEDVNPLDYVEDFKFIEPWGPYVGNYKYPGQYTYQLGVHLLMNSQMGKAKQYLARHIPDESKRPGLIAFPHASQGDFGIAEPEGIYFDTLCAFTNGWQGSFAYHFPDGFDARYWNALAKANRAISQFEDFLADGRMQMQHRLQVLTPLPKLTRFTAPSVHQQISNAASLIFTHEIANGKQRIIAVGNAWKYGDAFVRLSLDNVVASGKYVLHEPLTGRCYANEQGEIVLSAGNLKKGLVLHVGALRFAFFQVEPYQPGKNYGKAIQPKDLAESMTAFEPDIMKAIQFENQYHGQSH